MKNTFVITNSSIMVDIGEEVPFTIFKENPAYEQLVGLLSGKDPKDVDWEKVREVMNPTVEKLSDNQMRKSESGKIEVLLEDGTWFECPEDLGKVLNRFMDSGTELQPLVKFTQKLAKNPSKNSVAQLFTFLNRNKFTITESGDFIGFRSIRKNWTDWHTGKMCNKPGTVVSLPREKISENPNDFCHYGLHVANWNYAYNTFNGKGADSRMMYVSVNPAHVVSVPSDHGFSKIRTEQFTCLGEIDMEQSSNLYSSEKGFHDSEYEPTPEEYVKFEG